ncbi:hypothetical protein ONZ45_g18421 [Pleurotus djamor]|nr:hypothetical protein ONZ45_g18421 [Pleurotus djamor]
MHALPILSYLLSLIIPRLVELLIDTGSSNTWVKAERYVHTNTSRQTINRVSVTYGSGSFSGIEFIDLVDLGTGLNISQQSIGVANKSSGFRDIDGILGIGPAGLTVGTLRPNALRSIPTVTDNLFAAGTISQNLIGISYNPTIVEDAVNGELSWGGIDSSKLNGSVSFTPITSTFPASRYWGVNQSIRYGSSTPILSATAGIVDTGTTLILLASDALDNYRNVTGAVYDDKTGLLRITPAQFANLQSLFFTINGVSYELTPNAQIWPRVFNTEIGGTQSDIYLIVSDIDSPSGTGLDFINGYAFLQRYYTVYDTTNSRVGFATTPHTFATSN